MKTKEMWPIMSIFLVFHKRSIADLCKKCVFDVIRISNTIHRNSKIYKFPRTRRGNLHLHTELFIDRTIGWRNIYALNYLYTAPSASGDIYEENIFTLSICKMLYCVNTQIIKLKAQGA